MTILRLGGVALTAALGLGLAAACGSDDGGRNARGSEAPGGAGAATVEGGAASGGKDSAGGALSGGAAGESTRGGAGGDATASGGASGEPSSNGGAGGDVTAVGGAAGAGGAAEPTVDLSLYGCQEVEGQRPASTGTVDSPQVADLELRGGNEPDENILGSFAFADTDPKEMIVQVDGADVHYVCPFSEEELSDGQARLANLSLNAAFPLGSRLAYFGARDFAGNVSAYLVADLRVGDVDDGVNVCESKSVLLMGAVPSASTTFYEESNGTSGDYRLGSASGSDLIIVGETRLRVNLGECSTLRLAGDAAGTKPLGWDNCLVIDYYATPGGDPTDAWAFCGDYGAVYSVQSGQPVTVPLKPSLAGNVLSPAVPSQLLFGYPPLTIDLTSLIPDGDKDFELGLQVLDFGGVGSTTEIWALGGGEP